MRGTCPSCGASLSLDTITEDAAARRVGMLLGQLPPSVAKAMPAYLALFRPEQRGLRWTRAETVLAELVEFVRDGFGRRQRRCKPSADVWHMAIADVAARDLRRPLRNHGYLLEVVMKLAGQHEAVSEQRTEALRREGRREMSDAEKTIDLANSLLERGLIDQAERDRRVREAEGG